MSEQNSRDTVAATVRVGLIGSGIQASRSPAMHMAEAAALGLRLCYELFDLDRLGGADALETVLARIEDEGFAGVNITHPCKQGVLGHLHEISPEARLIGAVNTVLFRAGRRIGHNTDWFGFAEALRRGLAGGGARAGDTTRGRGRRMCNRIRTPHVRCRSCTASRYGRRARPAALRPPRRAFRCRADQRDVRRAERARTQ